MTATIRSGREPFEVSMLIVSLIYGVSGLAFYDKIAATSVRLYPAPGGIIFLAAMAFGALVTLVGLFGPHRRDPRGVYVEAAGLVMLTGLCLSYAAWTPFSTGVRGTGLMLYLGIAIAFPGMWRLLQIRQFLRAVREGGTQ